MKRARKTKRTYISLKYKLLFSSLFIFIISFFLILLFGELLGNPTPPEESGKADRQRINLLLLGLDSDRLRTDLIMLASLDATTNKADIIIIPDNTRMYIGGRNQKISAAYALTSDGEQKKIAGTVDALNRLTGIPINYYIEFTSEDFISLIDELGGIEFDIPQNMKYTDKKQNLYINLKKGHQLLNGKKAYNLLQFASYDEGVSRRNITQSEFFKAFAEQKFNSEYIGKFSRIFKSLDFNTNLSVAEVLRYSAMLSDIDADDVSFHICPGRQEEGTVTYWIPDKDALREITEDELGYYQGDSEATDEQRN